MSCILFLRLRGTHAQLPQLPLLLHESSLLHGTRTRSTSVSTSLLLTLRSRYVAVSLYPALIPSQTDSIIRHALSEGSTAPRKPRARLIHIYAGKSLFIPFCPLSDPTVMRMLRLRSLDHFEGLQPNRWGIREVNPAEADTLEDGAAFSLALGQQRADERWQPRTRSTEDWTLSSFQGYSLTRWDSVLGTGGAITTATSWRPRRATPASLARVRHSQVGFSLKQDGDAAEADEQLLWHSARRYSQKEKSYRPKNGTSDPT